MTTSAGVLAGGTAMVATALPVQASSSSAAHIVVRPGESIQHAVDGAHAGDTIRLLPGVYRGGILVRVSGLTIRGAGAATVIAPAATSATATGSAQGAGVAEPVGADCSAPGNGICVLGTAGHPVTDVRIESLTVSDFPQNGVSGSGTDRMTVRDVMVNGNGDEGISQEKSTRGRLVGNRAVGNGQAGIFVTNMANGKGGALDTEGTVIAGNRMSGNRFGADLRRARNLLFEDNTVTENCSGIFVVGDDGVPRGGDLTVRDNRVSRNNEYCPPNGRLPYLQGIGIVLTGVEKTVLTGNLIEGNVGAAPMSGGVVLFRSYKGGPDTDNTVTGNTITGNKPANIADRDGGPGNTFSDNSTAQDRRHGAGRDHQQAPRRRPARHVPHPSPADAACRGR
ncbi:nitrous oxide reductase family maturation protein NosD [Catenulispora sp. GP43]|uniref:right-handed parallel beta-helix repeat-containing protein n=1 Tax=Catenulispora sp. GP43 TaxID=3156263 RepID=UPI003517A9BC